MFGGHGLYVDDLFVAIIASDRLYLKADAQTHERFERAGCEPFVYDAKSRAISLGYWSAPDEAMESPALMEPWARLALEAALRARAAVSMPGRPKGEYRSAQREGPMSLERTPPLKTRAPAKAAATRPARPSAGAKAKR
jgi:DNA transformation protein